MLDASSYARHEIYNLFLTLKPTSHPTHPHSQLRLAKLRLHLLSLAKLHSSFTNKHSQLKLEMLDTSFYAYHEIYNLFLTPKLTSHPTNPHSQLRLTKLDA